MTDGNQASLARGLNKPTAIERAVFAEVQQMIAEGEKFGWGAGFIIGCLAWLFFLWHPFLFLHGWVWFIVSLVLGLFLACAIGAGISENWLSEAEKLKYAGKIMIVPHGVV